MLEKESKEVKETTSGLQTRVEAGEIGLDELRSSLDGVLSKLISFKRKVEPSFSACLAEATGLSC